MQTLALKFSKHYLASFIGLPLSCYSGIFLVLLESILMGIFYFLTIYFVEVLHFSIPEAGVIISFYGIGALFGGYTSGIVSDRIYPIACSALCLFCQSILLFFLSKLTNYFYLLALVFGLGFFTYSFITTSHLFILDNANKQDFSRIKVISLLSAASNLGLSISAILIPSLQNIGFQKIFLLFSFSLFLLGLYQLMFSFYTLPQSSNLKLDFIRPIVSPPKKNLKFVFISLFLIGCIISQQGNTYVLYLKNSFPNLGIRAASRLFTLNTLMVVCLSTSIGVMLTNRNKVIIAAIGSFLIGSGMLILCLSSLFHFYLIAFISCAIYTLGEIIYFTMVQYLCYATGSKKGRSLGTFRSIYAASRIAGPTAGTFLYYHLGGNMLWVICFLIGIFCFIMLFFLKESISLAIEY